MTGIELPRKITALVTPFKVNEQINYEAFRENVAFQIANGWTPLVLGTTGEAPTMREGEFERLVKIAVEEAEGGFVLVGTGSNSTYHTQKKTELAAELGASAALVVMPYYNKPGPAGQLAHMKAAARIMPIVPYDVSSRTAKPMDLNVIAELSGHPRVIGYKAATHEIYDKNRELLWVQSERVTQELASDTFRVWSGDDSRTLSLMQQGAYGVISVASNAAPGQLGDMIDNAAEGDYLIAEKLNQELSNFFVDLF